MAHSSHRSQGTSGSTWRAVPLQTLAKLVLLEDGADSRTRISRLPPVCHVLSTILLSPEHQCLSFFGKGPPGCTAPGAQISHPHAVVVASVSIRERNMREVWHAGGHFGGRWQHSSCSSCTKEQIVVLLPERKRNGLQNHPIIDSASLIATPFHLLSHLQQ